MNLFGCGDQTGLVIDIGHQKTGNFQYQLILKLVFLHIQFKFR